LPWIAACRFASRRHLPALVVLFALFGGNTQPVAGQTRPAPETTSPAGSSLTEPRYSNFPLCTWRDGICESSFGPTRQVRIPREVLDTQMWRHTVIHTGGRGPTQELGTLRADYRRITGRPASPDDWPVRITVHTPPFPPTMDEAFAHIESFAQADAIRAARRGGADARIVTRQGTISGEFELIIRRGRIVSVNWCKPGTPPRGAPVCRIRAVRGDVSLSIAYDPRGSPGTDEMIRFAVEFANRFIVAGPPIPIEETE
jgi:hypothetical protein